MMDMILSKLKKGIRFLRNYGIKEFFVRLSEKAEKENLSYEEWQKAHKLTEREVKVQRKRYAEWSYKPFFHILIIDASKDAAKVETTRRSLEAQSYSEWKVCTDFEKLDSWVLIVTAGDVVSPETLYRYAERIRTEGFTDLLYADSDEFVVENSKYQNPYFKPGFSLDLLRTHNYIGYSYAIRGLLLKELFGVMNIENLEAFTKKKVYEVLFRCAEKNMPISRVPRILTHVSLESDEMAISQKQEEKVIREHLERVGVDGEYIAGSIRYNRKSNDLVSIIIPSKDEVESLKTCLESIERSIYQHYEVIIVENNSCAETFGFYKTIAPREIIEGQLLEGNLAGGQRIAVAIWKDGFNYSKLNNFGVSFAKGNQYVFMNNDIELLTKDWLEILLGQCQRKEVGIVGIKLYYPDDTIQHAGIVVGIGGSKRGIAANMLVGLDRKDMGYRNKAVLQTNYSAVTAACMMVTKKAYDLVGGFSEELAVAFNDVDFCLKVREQGMLIVFEPNVEAYHYESKSRGAEDTPEKVKRFAGEIDTMRKKWPEILEKGDPYYNPNFSKVYSNYSLGN